MSNAIFPTLPGLAWNVVKQPEFATLSHRAVSGVEARASMMAYPLWTFKMSYEVLRAGNLGADLTTLMGFFTSRRGSFDSFLFTDPDDYLATQYQFGVGDGVTTQFQLARSLGGFAEPVHNPASISEMRVGEVATAAYSVDAEGMVTFNVAPAPGDAIDWTGAFYHRVRFTADLAEFNKVMQDLWELRRLEFIGSVMNKV